MKLSLKREEEAQAPVVQVPAVQVPAAAEQVAVVLVAVRADEEAGSRLRRQ